MTPLLEELDDVITYDCNLCKLLYLCPRLQQINMSNLSSTLLINADGTRYYHFPFYNGQFPE